MKYERLTERVRTHVLVENQTDALKRLAELEDKIEQGTLIELPCIIECFNGLVWQVVFQDKSKFIRALFVSTKEEAEKKLKELQECSK